LGFPGAALAAPVGVQEAADDIIRADQTGIHTWILADATTTAGPTPNHADNPRRRTD